LSYHRAQTCQYIFQHPLSKINESKTLNSETGNNSDSLPVNPKFHFTLFQSRERQRFYVVEISIIGNIKNMGMTTGRYFIQGLGTRISLIAIILRRMLVHLQGASAVSYCTYEAVDATPKMGQQTSKKL